MITRSIRAMEDQKLNQTAQRNSANSLQHKTPKKQEKIFENCKKPQPMKLKKTNRKQSKERNAKHNTMIGASE